MECVTEWVCVTRSLQKRLSVSENSSAEAEKMDIVELSFVVYLRIKSGLKIFREPSSLRIIKSFVSSDLMRIHHGGNTRYLSVLY
jgi:hypothetical protein